MREFCIAAMLNPSLQAVLCKSLAGLVGYKISPLENKKL